MVLREMRDGCACCGTIPCEMLPHEPATCPDLEDCEHCAGWRTGYGVGKEKAHAELRPVRPYPLWFRFLTGSGRQAGVPSTRCNWTGSAQSQTSRRRVSVLVHRQWCRQQWVFNILSPYRVSSFHGQGAPEHGYGRIRLISGRSRDPATR